MITQYDIEFLRNVLGYDPERHDVRLRALYVIEEFINLTNNMSDGWGYWPIPSRAAKKLCELIEAGKDFDRPAPPATVAEFKKALRPIKACLTRHKEAFGRSLLLEPFLDLLAKL